MERGSAPWFTFNAHLATHEFYESLADRQSQPSPPILARVRTVDLTECAEEAVHSLGRNADARVLYRKMEFVPLCGGRCAGARSDCASIAMSQRYGTNANDNLAGWCELDGVAEKIDENLSK